MSANGGAASLCVFLVCLACFVCLFGFVKRGPRHGAGCVRILFARACFIVMHWNIA